MKKEITIFIAGANKFSKWPKLSQKICTLLSKPLKLDKTDTEYTKFWKKDIRFKKKSNIWMKWSRKTDIFSKSIAVYKLKKLLKKNQNINVNLVGISLGGGIILKTIQKKKYSNIKKIILIASINENKEIKNNKIPIYNIYSEKDNFAKFAIKLYSFNRGALKLNGESITNIPLPGMQHHELCENVTIKKGKYLGKRVTELVFDILNK